MDLRTGHPFWLVKNGLLNSYPPLRNDERCEVAIIGAGITGALLAHSLAEHGVNCVVLDGRDVGTGSTVASTALLQYEIDTELAELIERVGEAQAVRAYRLGLEAIDRIEAVVGGMPHDCGFVRKESFYFASRRSHGERVRKGFECLARHGFDVEYVTPGDAAARFPFGPHGGILSRGDATIDAYQFTHALLAAAGRRGARVYDRTKVESLTREGAEFVLVSDRGPRVTAPRVVVAAGYEASRFLKTNRGTLHSTYAAISEPMDPLPDWPGHCLIWESERPYFYLRTTPDGRVLIGGEDTPYSNDHRSESRLAGKTKRLVKRFERLFPGHAFEVAYDWAGTFGETQDGLAFVGEPADQPGVAFALGYGGNGITMSVIAARILTDHCLGRPNADAAIFRFDR